MISPLFFDFKLIPNFSQVLELFHPEKVLVHPEKVLFIP
jgi:hypothetical protein